MKKYILWLQEKIQLLKEVLTSSPYYDKVKNLLFQAARASYAGLIKINEGCIRQAQRLKNLYDTRQHFETQQEWMDPILLAKTEQPKLTARIYFWTLGGLVLAFLIWSTTFKIEEFVHAQAKVEPETEIKTISHGEGGTIAKILVTEGQMVKKGDLLLKLKDAPFQAAVKDNKETYYLMLGHSTRLKAQLNDIPFVLPKEVEAYSPNLAKEIEKAYHDRMDSYKNELKIAENQINQRKYELEELKIREKNLQEVVDLADQVVKLLTPLAEKKLITRTQVINAEKDRATKKTELESVRANIPKTEEALKEAEKNIDKVKNSYTQKDQEELVSRQTQLSDSAARLSSSSERLELSSLTSPVDGLIQDIKGVTEGSSVSPGKDILTIVPIKDTLLVIAEVTPQDIGFVHPNLPATIKVTAYDYSIYGSMKGVVESISPDTYFDPQQRPYFKVKIRIPTNALEHEGHKYIIGPGMTADVSILTGKRTIMQYLLKPIIKTLSSSLHER